MLPRIVAAMPIEGHRLHLLFSDGVEGDVDLSAGPFLGVLAPLRDPGFFARVRVDAERGTLVWPGEVDICPDVLYSEITGTPLPGAADGT